MDILMSKMAKFIQENVLNHLTTSNHQRAFLINNQKLCRQREDVSCSYSMRHIENEIQNTVTH